ncbi:MAG: glycosyltransferase family 4 protein [Chloroflexales bacterium]|nr:glycosyltransferase family 4 protein [Chloroflexales bacterium]
MKLGIIASEFFDPALGRMGGFGWAARQVARCFQGDPSLGVQVVYLTADRAVPPRGHAPLVHGARLLALRPQRAEDRLALLIERIDLLLTIDYRPGFRTILQALPRTPLVVWVRDPHTPDDRAKIRTLRIPSAPAVLPRGAASVDCTSLADVLRAARAAYRPFILASPAPHLAAKLAGAYGMDASLGIAPELPLLPNLVDLEPQGVVKSEHPRVVFLGRLDPIKRPWLVVALADRFPEVEFLLLGKRHFFGTGSWEPEPLPPNVRLVGHVDGPEKLALLASAWLLVNTSIHEGLAVSFLEALACETPIVSCQNPGGVVSRFGRYVGRWDGSGTDALPQFAAALDALLRDQQTRLRLGKEGRQWVMATHSQKHFLTAFSAICKSIGASPSWG